MSELGIQELERVADSYEQLLVPALFGEWADRLADAAEIRPGQRVLDVACGTGVLARTVARRVGPTGSVSAIDANPGMLAVARRVSPGIDWREGSAESLPYDGDTFDAVVSQFALMLFSDPEGALGEMRRVLKPDGHLVAAVFGAIDSLPAYTAMVGVYERVVDKGVGDMLRVPFSMGDPDRLASLFDAAGIGVAVIETREGKAYFPDVRNMVLSDVKGWFPFAGIHLDEGMIEAVVREAETALEPFRTSEGAVEFRVPVHMISATKT